MSLVKIEKMIIKITLTKWFIGGTLSISWCCEGAFCTFRCSKVVWIWANRAHGTFWSSICRPISRFASVFEKKNHFHKINSKALLVSTFLNVLTNTINDASWSNKLCCCIFWTSNTWFLTTRILIISFITLWTP